jgi:hypothetical protein
MVTSMDMRWCEQDCELPNALTRSQQTVTNEHDQQSHEERAAGKCDQHCAKRLLVCHARLLCLADHAACKHMQVGGAASCDAPQTIVHLSVAQRCGNLHHNSPCLISTERSIPAGDRRQEDEAHILHLPHRKLDGGQHRENRLVDRCAQQHQAHQAARVRPEEFVLQQRKGLRSMCGIFADIWDILNLQYHALVTGMSSQCCLRCR